MKAGYKGDELRQIDQERAVRRSFFQKSRRLESTLRVDPLWRVYKAFRRLAAEQLQDSTEGPASDKAIDAHLERTLPGMLEQIAGLFVKDKEARTARASMATWSWLDPEAQVEEARAASRAQARDEARQREAT